MYIFELILITEIIMSNFKKIFKDELIKFLINYINENQYNSNYSQIKEIIIQFLDDNYIIDKSLLVMFFVHIIKKNHMINTYVANEFDSIIDYDLQISNLCSELFVEDYLFDEDTDNIIIDHIILDFEKNIVSPILFEISSSTDSEIKSVDEIETIQSIDCENDYHRTFFIRTYKYPIFTYIKTWINNYISDMCLLLLYIIVNFGVAYYYYNKEYISNNLFRQVAQNIKISKMSVGLININIILCFLSISSFVDRFYKIMPWWIYSWIPLYRFKTLHFISGTIFLCAIIIHVFTHIINLFIISDRINLCTFNVLNMNKLGLDKYLFYNSYDILLTYPFVSGFVILIFVIIHLYYILRLNNKISFFRLFNLRSIRHSLFLNNHWKLTVIITTLLLFHGARQWLSATTNWMWTVWFLVYYIVDNRLKIFRLNKSTIVYIKNYQDKILELTINRPKYINIDNVGMSCLINIPYINKHEWHPFTIDYTVDSIIFNIEIVGQWSQTLKRISEEESDSGYIELYNKDIYLSRCYNNVISYVQNYNISIIYIFGICITSLISFLKEVKNNNKINPISKKIFIIWTLNDMNILYIFKDLINEIINNKDYNISFYIFMTQKIDDFDNQLLTYIQYKSLSLNNIDILSGIKKHKIYFRRPNLTNILKNIVQYSNDNNYIKKIGVFLCGSPNMQKNMKEICNQHNYNIYNILLQYHKVQ